MKLESMFALSFGMLLACGSQATTDASRQSAAASTATSGSTPTGPGGTLSAGKCTYHEFGVYASNPNYDLHDHDTNHDCPSDKFRYSCQKVVDGDMTEFQPGYCEDRESDSKGCVNLRCGCGEGSYRDKFGFCWSYGEDSEANLPPGCVESGACADIRDCVKNGTCHPSAGDMH